MNMGRLFPVLRHFKLFQPFLLLFCTVMSPVLSTIVFACTDVELKISHINRDNADLAWHNDTEDLHYRWYHVLEQESCCKMLL